MKTLGIVGGIGSGKSTVAGVFEKLGAALINADEIGHQVLQQDEIKQAAALRWGTSVFDSQGELDRPKLAAIVFTETEAGKIELEFLQSLTHPSIGNEIDHRIEQFCQSGKRVAVLDIPLLFETNWSCSVDKVLFVDAPRPVRLERVLKRGWTETEFNRREAAQLPLEEKRNRADWVLKNYGNSDQMLDQVVRIWENLKRNDSV